MKRTRGGVINSKRDQGDQGDTCKYIFMCPGGREGVIFLDVCLLMLELWMKGVASVKIRLGWKIRRVG